MIGDALNTAQLLSLLSAEEPEWELIRHAVILAYNLEHGESLSLNSPLPDSQRESITRWLNKCIDHPSNTVRGLFVQRRPQMQPFFSQNLSSKVGCMSQFHCPLCRTSDYPIQTLHRRIAPISKQATKARFRKAFESAIRKSFEGKIIDFKKGRRLCVLIIFVMNQKTKEKDLDNMAKALMDALQGVLFYNDRDVDHLNLFKIRHEGEETYVSINIRYSDLNTHKDVLFKEFRHIWTSEELNIEEFL